MWGDVGPPSSSSSWFDTGMTIPLHPELGTRDQANLIRLDCQEELVWVGTQRGRLLSYLVNTEAGHSSYSRFNIDVKEERVMDILTRPEGVISLTRSSVLFHTRGGVGHQLATPKAVKRMTAAGGGNLTAVEQFPFNDVHIAVCTSDKNLFYLDSLSGELSAFVQLPHSAAKIHCCKETALMAVGSSNGLLSFVEGRIPRIALASSASLPAHPSEITSIASVGSYVFTCGKRVGASAFVPDVFLKVFDVRNLRKPAVAVTVPSGALKVAANGKGNGICSLAVLSSFGMWQQGDLFFPTSSNLSSLKNTQVFQTECFQPHSPDLEPGVVDWSVNEGMNAMLDSAGVVHFWSFNFPPRVNSVCANAIQTPSRQPAMPSYPMPLSGMNHEIALDNLGRTRVYSDTVRDGSWLSWWGFDSPGELFFQTPAIALPTPLLPAIAANCKDWDSHLRYCPNTFGFKYGSLVVSAREGLKKSKSNRIGKQALPPEGPVEEEKRWSFNPVDFSINHSLFAFNAFNKTNRTGLENDQLNPLIQCLYNLTWLKAVLKAHICSAENCLSCELGFLFHMMDEARFSRSKVCQPVRVSRLWKRLFPQSISIPEMASNFIKTLRREFVERNETEIFESFFGSDYSGSVIKQRIDGSIDFSSAASVAFVQLNGSCSSLIKNPQSEYILNSVIFGSLSVSIHHASSNPTPRSGVGSLHAVALVAVTDDLDTEHHVTSQRPSRSNSFILGPTTSSSVEEDEEEEEDEKWILFNDFTVTPSSLEEAAVRSSIKPVLAVYLKSAPIVPPPPSPFITVDDFKRDESLSANTDLENLRFNPLTDEEMDLVLRGDFTVALDTEFISIGLAAIEIREDGSREIGKPGDMAVGRVSVLRESGVPFIDHYVAMDESEIKDYVTRFSGIRPGDLDPGSSTHWLVSSKSLYKKLRFLVDCGCKFVGHGLHTDFRIINLWVNSSALIDTVELFHLPGQRFLSLKFLAGKLLNRSIQGDVHCSIEDARTALELYKVHQRLKAEGTLEQTLKGLYDAGRASGWK